MQNTENKQKFDSDPEYRKQVIRELEGTGTIERMSKEVFGQVVYGGINDNIPNKG